MQAIPGAIHRVENYNKTEAKQLVEEAKVNHGKQIILQNKRWRWSAPPPPPPPQSPMIFERVDKIL